MARYVDWALADVQAKMGSRSWLTARVGQMLVERIDHAVERATQLPLGGTMTDDELLVLERHSLETNLLTVHLNYDVIDVGNGEDAPGRFGHVVAENLLANPPRPYAFLLSTHGIRSLAAEVHAFRRLLREELGVPEDRLRLCEFRTTSERVLVGCCFYRLDIDAIRAHEPGLALAIAEYVSADGWLASTINRNSETMGEILMGSDYVSDARGTFLQLWSEAIPHASK